MTSRPIPSPSWRSAPVQSAPRTPLRRPGSAHASPSSRGRRPAASPSASASSSGRRAPRPAWNGYLTDDQQYRLTREERLLKQMQQLSAAHFHGRAAPVGRRDEEEESWSRGPHGSFPATSPRGRRVELRVEDDEVFSEHQHPDSRHKMRRELAMLEHMLSDLERETKRLDTSEYVDDDDEENHDEDDDKSYRHPQHGGRSKLVTVEEEAIDEEAHESGEALDSTHFDDPVTMMCFKSLQVGIDLTQKVQMLTDQLETERHYRKRQQRRIRELEQHCTELQEHSDKSEARYQDLSQQVDAMRDAMIATGEALHRIRQDLFPPRDDSFAVSSPLEAHSERSPFRSKNAQRASPRRRSPTDEDKENYFEHR